MHGAEIFGKTISVNVARPSTVVSRAGNFTVFLGTNSTVWDTSLPSDSAEVDAALKELEQTKQQEQDADEQQAKKVRV